MIEKNVLITNEDADVVFEGKAQCTDFVFDTETQCMTAKCHLRSGLVIEVSDFDDEDLWHGWIS